MYAVLHGRVLAVVLAIILLLPLITAMLASSCHQAWSLGHGGLCHTCFYWATARAAYPATAGLMGHGKLIKPRYQVPLPCHCISHAFSWFCHASRLIPPVRHQDAELLLEPDATAALLDADPASGRWMPDATADPHHTATKMLSFTTGPQLLCCGQSYCRPTYHCLPSLGSTLCLFTTAGVLIILHGDWTLEPPSR